MVLIFFSFSLLFYDVCLDGREIENVRTFVVLEIAQILVGIGSVSSQYGESSKRRCGNVAYGTCVGSLAHWQRGYPGTCNLYNVAYQT